MFDIGFIELVICAVIALLVLGPERLPAAARTAGRWVGGARRMVTQFTSELDRELKADELRKELRKAGDIGLDDVEKTVRGALDEAKQYEDMILSDSQPRKPEPAPATRQAAVSEGERPDHQEASAPQEPDDRSSEDSPQSGTGDDRERFRKWEAPAVPDYDPHAMIRSERQPAHVAEEPTDSGTPEPPKDKPERDS